jgi:cytoskeletal protein RodZ
MSNFFSGIAVVISLISGLTGVFTVFKVSSIEQQVETLNQSVANQQKAQTNLAQEGTAEAPTPQDPKSITNEASPAATNAVTSIQPGQFVQPAIENTAEVTLLTVKRIQDPETGARDVVNVQFRVRRVGRAGVGSIITPVNTKARNPDTGETYDSYRTAGVKAGKRPSENRATLGLTVLRFRENASVDAYVWMKIPEGVNIVDIYIPATQPFRNVPIAS